MTKVNVVAGGTSSEREVSLRSGNAVKDALIDAGYDAVLIDTSVDDIELCACDVVFPVLHGVGGEDGQFQARLESLKMPYVGSDSTSSMLCMDKALYRNVMIKLGFLMPKGAVVDEKSYLDHPLAKKPHVLKPTNGGSSVDTFIIRDITIRDEKSIHRAFMTHQNMLIETCIDGHEITVGVLDGQALPVVEIVPPADGEFDYENKYNGLTAELCPPVNIPKPVQKHAQQIAEAVHLAARCRHFSRTDFIMQDDGEVFLLETNTIPGMTAQSLYPKAAAASGLSMPALCARLVESALN